jgi:RNase P subunit RPR2
VRLLDFIKRNFCNHPSSQQIRRVDSGHLFVECLLCGDKSPGITPTQRERAA